MAGEETPGGETPGFAGFRGPAGPRPAAGPAPVWDAGNQKPLPSALDQLGPQARSIIVPGILLVLLAVTGLAVSISGLAGMAGVIGDSEALEGEVTDSFRTADTLACADERRDTRAALDSYVADTGEVPDDLSALVPTFLDEVPPNYRIVRGELDARPDGPCAATDDVDLAERDIQDRYDEAYTAVSGSSAYDLFISGMVLFGASLAFQGFWLATAYRCMPRSRQTHPAKRAYGPVVVFAVTAAIYYPLQAAVVGSSVDGGGGSGGGLLLFGISMVSLFLMVRALLRAIDMLGDVTFHFQRGHYLTSRVMRLSLKGFFLVPVIGTVLGIGLAVAGAVEVAALILTASLLVGLGLFPVVAFVAYAVAIVLATVGVEQALGRARDDLNGVATP